VLEQPLAEHHLIYDPSCYLCPGNQRAGGVRNPSYVETFVFDNDFPALLPDTERQQLNGDELLIEESERGLCRVVCYSPRHDLTLAEMELDSVARVVDVWAEQYAELGAIPWVRHVQIFENRGASMGASNPHPHGQIWADERLPNEPVKELRQQRTYAAEHGNCLLCDYLSLELRQCQRVVCENESFVALVPFWARWPFETLVLPRRHLGALPELGPIECQGLAEMLRRLTRRYDRLFAVPFPYSMGFHQRPTDDQTYPEWHLHAHFYPPLLSATVRKFMVGYEMLGQPQRDITPEQAAERLRQLPEL
jgi:UDPglucose--hexose-1-phosphate uridylyltransferase